MTDDQTTEDARISDATKPDAPELDVHQPDETPETEPKVFDEAYVQRLRDEAAGYRVKAKAADALAARLHTALVAATGKLADPTDLAFDPAHLDDETALTAAVDDLLTKKPHLAARKVAGDVGQGARGGTSQMSLLDFARQRI